MHDGVIWYDTYACLPLGALEGPVPSLNNLVGGVNTQNFIPKETEAGGIFPERLSQTIRSGDNRTVANPFVENNQVAAESILEYEAWSKGISARSEVNPGLTTTDALVGGANPLQALASPPVDAAGVENWQTNIKPAQLVDFSEKINWKDDIFNDLMKDVTEIIDDCDIDCQAKGSQLSVVHLLNSLALFFIQIQAILMFIGTWRSTARICQVYCNFFTCLFQFAVIITSMALLFSKYSAFCGKSVIRTAGDSLLWTMKDDYDMAVGLVLTQIIWMFAFFFCGLCSADRSPQEFKG